MTETPLPPPAGDRGLPHVRVPWIGQDIDYRGRGGGPPPRLRSIADRGGHAEALKRELTMAFDKGRQMQQVIPEGLRPDGVTLCIGGWSDEPGYELALKSLDSSGAHLLAVTPADRANGVPERAFLWMPSAAMGKFLTKLEQFASENTTRGDPKHRKLVANIKSIELATLRQLWQEETPFPETEVALWWEISFANLPDLPDPAEHLPQIVDALDLRLAPMTLAFRERTVAAVHATTSDLGKMLSTSVVIAELHRPLHIIEFLTAEAETQGELVEDLRNRLEPAAPEAPAVCQLDTGITREHPLLRDSVDDTLSVPSLTDTADLDGHGTSMAGLALYGGDLRKALAHNGPVRLAHRLESVKFVDPQRPHLATPPELYGAVTAQAAATIEIAAPVRRRVFSMPVTATDAPSTGKPTSWSSAMDAISMGTDITESATGIRLIGTPDPNSRRLFVVSAGNIPAMYFNGNGHPGHLSLCDSERVEDPAQAWNVLTVGAYTELAEVPTDQSFHGWVPVATPGELSPHSRTSILFDGKWPLKPDIVLEGGNLLRNSSGTEQGNHEVVELLTTAKSGGLTTANATSAATAQAARLATLAMARYPLWWPESIRGLLVHSAEWPEPVRREIFKKRAKKSTIAQFLRRYGWGVPTEARVLSSGAGDVTMLIEDEFQPFVLDNGNVAMRAARVHQLPWPCERLRALGEAEVRMRITLSYFIEPNPSNLGWEVRYRYASHQLRFDVKRPTDLTIEEFRTRVNREAQQEEANNAPTRVASDKRWLIGTDNRYKGSLHGDMWIGTAAELADSGAIAVVPVGGWWKDNRRRDRAELPVRYSLLVSLTSEVPVDIYSEIAAAIEISLPITV